MKGLCQESKVDNDYLLLGYDAVVNEGRHQERTYGGSTGWLLTYEKDEDSWQVKHEHYPHLTLTMEDKDQLPVGVHSWIAANNTCTLGQTVRLVFFSKIRQFFSDTQKRANRANFYYYFSGAVEIVIVRTFLLILSVQNIHKHFVGACANIYVFCMSGLSLLITAFNFN